MKNFSHRKSGFIRIILVVIVTILVLTMSGFDIQSITDRERLLNILQSTLDRAQTIYQTKLSEMVAKYVINPSRKALDFIHHNIIATMKHALQQIITSSG